MSAPEAQYNDEDAGRLLASRPLLTDMSVSRLACLREERYITLDSGGGQGLAVSRSQGRVCAV
jgi:hypothetical protein